MSKVYYDDEWKRAKDPVEIAPPIPKANPTRAQEQARIDNLYGNGLIEREEWLERTAELSDPLKWSAEGKIK